MNAVEERWLQQVLYEGRDRKQVAQRCGGLSFHSKFIIATDYEWYVCRREPKVCCGCCAVWHDLLAASLAGSLISIMYFVSAEVFLKDRRQACVEKSDRDVLPASVCLCLEAAWKRPAGRQPKMPSPQTTNLHDFISAITAPHML